MHLESRYSALKLTIRERTQKLEDSLKDEISA